MKNLLVFLPCVILFSGCSTKSDQELFSLAQSAKQRGSFDSTIMFAERLRSDFPKSQLSAPALYLIAESYYRGKGQPARAIGYYRQFVTQFPDLNATPVALFVTGFIYNNDLQRSDSAEYFYKEFLSRFPNHELAASAKLELETMGKSPDQIIQEKQAAASMKSGQNTTARRKAQ